MPHIGYARVSSTGQSLEVQLEKLKSCDKIYQEKKSAKTDNRLQLQTCLDYVRDGDFLVITKLDRLARSTRDLLNIVNKLQGQNVQLRVIDQHIDTSTPTGKLMLAMLGAIAEFENDIRKERQVDGIEMAKSKGVQFGRRPALTPEQIREMKQLRESGIRVKDLMAKYRLSKATIYRLLPT